MSKGSLVILPFGDVAPKLAAAPVHCGECAAVLGRVFLDQGAWLGQQSVIRADGHDIRIGRNLFLGPKSTIHIAHEVYPAIVGNDVSADEGAVIHACEIGDECVLGREAIVLDGSVVGSSTILAPGSMVYPRSELKGGWLYSGRPARPKRPLEPGELESQHAHIRSKNFSTSHSLKVSQKAYGNIPTPNAYIACTTSVFGSIDIGSDAGIWFSCHLNAGSRRIKVGPRSNIQDNTTISCRERDVVIDEDVTIGHNVSLTDCTIGAKSLIGIGASVAAGTIVESDVLLAAGSHTKSGQILESGSIWGGRPARRLAALDDAKRAMIIETIPIYCDYAIQFRRAQEALYESQYQVNSHGKW